MVFFSSSGSLPTRQVQMFDVAIPLAVELVLSAFYILPPSSSPASFVLVFLLIFFLAFSLRLPFLTVILLLDCVRSTSFVWFYCAYEGSFLTNRFQYFFICLMFCPADFLIWCKFLPRKKVLREILAKFKEGFIGSIDQSIKYYFIDNPPDTNAS